MTSDLIEKSLEKYSAHVKLLSTLAVVITSVVAIAGGYIWYKSNIWKPTVTVNDADFTNAVAHLIINGAAVVLYGNSTLAAGGEWGVRFGTTGLQSSADQYDTIELVKNNMVYGILKNNTIPLVAATK